MSQLASVTGLGVYWRATGPFVRRALSLQDTNPRSPTYGCCDRQFWHYRTVTGFAAATMQQLALPFAVLFEADVPGNEWCADPTMLERARAAIAFWTTLQHRSGSFDEWYRNEHSYCATAFTTFGIAEAALRIRAHLADEQFGGLSRAVGRAAAWLAARFNDLVMNQNLAACAALWNAHAITGDLRIREAFARTWDRTIRHQHSEGWFPEYGGADVGYSLLALDLLGSLHERGWSGALEAARPLSRFLSSFAYADSDFAGGLGSRGTEHAFAFGAEVFAPHIPEAAALAAALRSGLRANRLCRPEAVDDRYLAYFYLPSFALAASVKARATDDLPPHTDTERNWPDAGLTICRTTAANLVSSSNRVGAFTLTGASTAVHRNFGYWAETIDGRRWASCGWRPQGSSAPAQYRFEFRGAFVAIDDALPLVRGEAAFRFMTHRIFQWAAVAELFHRVLKQRRINRRRPGPFNFVRRLRWEADRLIVTDEIRRSAAATVRALGPVADIDVHSPSARMSGAEPVERIALAPGAAESWARQLNATGRLLVTTVYQPDDAGHCRFASIRIEER